MRSHWAFLATITFLGVTTAVPCSEIAWPTALDGQDNGHTDAKYPDPWDPQGRWEIYKAEQCWIRFQTPGDRGHGKAFTDARITKTKHEATPEKVFATINNFVNEPGKNEPLWLKMNVQAFQYAGILKNLGRDYGAIDAQSNLNRVNTVLSIILPRSEGAKSLKSVGPSGCNENTKRAIGSGLKGEIESSDYAYGTVAESFEGLWHGYRFKQRLPSPWNNRYAFMLAEKADPNECVVIDFRSIDFYAGGIMGNARFA